MNSAATLDAAPFAQGALAKEITARKRRSALVGVVCLPVRPIDIVGVVTDEDAIHAANQ